MTQSLPPEWSLKSPYCIVNARGDHVAKVVSRGVDGYLVWLVPPEGGAARLVCHPCFATSADAIAFVEAACSA